MQALCGLVWMEQGQPLLQLMCQLIQRPSAHQPASPASTAIASWPQSSRAIILGQLLHRTTLDPRLAPLLLQVRHDGVLQCVAVCCSVLQCVAVCCNMMQLMQCVVVCCTSLAPRRLLHTLSFFCKGFIQRQMEKAV